MAKHPFGGNAIKSNGDDWNIDIETCPFCGSDAQVRHIGNEHTKKRSVNIRCSKPGCCLGITVGALYHSMEWCEEKAVEKWNKRS